MDEHTLAYISIYHRGHLRTLNYDYQTCRNLSCNIKLHYYRSQVCNNYNAIAYGPTVNNCQYK